LLAGYGASLRSSLRENEGSHECTQGTCDDPDDDRGAEIGEILDDDAQGHADPPGNHQQHEGDPSRFGDERHDDSTRGGQSTRKPSARPAPESHDHPDAGIRDSRIWASTKRVIAAVSGAFCDA
jgi:hypothetical protein